MNKESPSYRPWLFLLLICGALLFYITQGNEILNFDNIKANLTEVQRQYEVAPFLVIFIFIMFYILITGLSIPGSLVLTLLAGAVFGPFLGTIFVALSGTLGALVAFFIARFFLKDFVMKKFSKHFFGLSENIKQNGSLYLLTLRLIPVSPYVVINLVAGLSSIRIWTFFWTTLVGMLPGNFIYVFAGQKISEINSPRAIMSPSIIISLLLLGLLPLLGKRLWEHHQRNVRVGH